MVPGVFVEVGGFVGITCLSFSSPMGDALGPAQLGLAHGVPTLHRVQPMQRDVARKGEHPIHERRQTEPTQVQLLKRIERLGELCESRHQRVHDRLASLDPPACLGDPRARLVERSTYVLGVSSGAALGAVVGLLLPFGLAPPVTAMAGAALALVVVFTVARSGGRLHTERMILAGVILSFVLSSVIMLILSLRPGPEMRGLVFWIMGSFNSQTLGASAVLGKATREIL